jgi:4'-phosphopantetheinyl transferase EntD
VGRPDPTPRSLREILPPGAVAVELEAPDRSQDRLYAGELELIADAVESRRREFTDGRACARRALSVIGLSPVAILAARDGAPIWPEGVVGSISHKRHYRAAAVARSSDLLGLGIDAELNEPLPDRVLGSIADSDELQDVERLHATCDQIAWDRLLFSAKEAVVKATQPLGLGRADFRASTVRLHTAGNTFEATPAFSSTATGHGTIPTVTGRWLARPDLLLVVASIRA